MSSGTFVNKQKTEYSVLCGRVTVSPTVLRLTSASNGLPGASNVAPGTYRVVSTVDCYFIQTNGGTVTTANASFLPAGTIELLPFIAEHNNIVAITDGGTGYLQLTKLGR